jgi:UDP-N-acetylmuramyl tripeptide synthase
VAGKGHEDYQEIGARRVPFEDVAEAASAIRGRAA